MTARHAVLLAVVALAGCGDNRPPGGADDAGDPDASVFPAPPVLGPQIGRLGRPLIATALIGVFATPGAGKTALKDAYNHASDPATWTTTELQPGVTIEHELAANLAVFDALDTGLAVAAPGCGNALRWVGPPSTQSYRGAADLFADDQLYVDTSKPTCTAYLALELELASGGALPHTSCGGRTPSHDVVDVTYSVLAAGKAGVDPANDLAPRIHDGVAVHGDLTSSFPYLGAPH